LKREEIDETSGGKDIFPQAEGVGDNMKALMGCGKGEI